MIALLICTKVQNIEKKTIKKIEKKWMIGWNIWLIVQKGAIVNNYRSMLFKRRETLK